MPRVYSARSYQNPFFNRRRKKIRRISLKIKFLIALVIALIAGLTWALFFNAYFLIGHVNIEGAKLIDQNKIYHIIDQQLQASGFFNQQNIFIFSKSRAKKEILNNFNVKDLRINKNLPDTLVISFTEKTPVAVWLENENYYYIDSDCNVLSQVDSLSVDATRFIILENELNDSLISQSGEGRQVSLATEYVLFGLQASKWAAQEGIGINNIFKINQLEKTMRMQIDAGPHVYFNIDNDEQTQLNKLKILLAEKLNENELSKLNYIDLRFGDKIFLK